MLHRIGSGSAGIISNSSRRNVVAAAGADLNDKLRCNIAFFSIEFSLIAGRTLYCKAVDAVSAYSATDIEINNGIWQNSTCRA